MVNLIEFGMGKIHSLIIAAFQFHSNWNSVQKSAANDYKQTTLFIGDLWWSCFASRVVNGILSDRMAARRKWQASVHQLTKHQHKNEEKCRDSLDRTIEKWKKFSEWSQVELTAVNVVKIEKIFQRKSDVLIQTQHSFLITWKKNSGTLQANLNTRDAHHWLNSNPTRSLTNWWIAQEMAITVE